MRQFPHLKRNHRSGNWVYFRRFPKPTSDAIGRIFFERSLRTADRKHLGEAWSDADRAFRAIVEGTVSPPASDQRTPVAMSQHWTGVHFPRINPQDFGEDERLELRIEEIKQAVSRWGDEEIYRRAQLIVNEPAYRQDAETFRKECRVVGACGEKKDYIFFNPPLASLTKSILDESGIKIPEMHGALYLVERVVEAEMLAVLEKEARWRDYDFSDLPDRAPVTAKPKAAVASGLSLQTLVERYISAGRKPRKTASKLRLVSRYICELGGRDLGVNEVSKSILIELQSSALNIPARLTKVERQQTLPMLAQKSYSPERGKLTPQAIRSWFNLLSGCFNWAVAADLMQANPTKGIKPKIRKTEERRRYPFSELELSRIFADADCAERKGARYWLPVLALYTGARLNELGQLLRTDIKFDGIPYIEITNETDDPAVLKRLKNLNSRRKIPIHAHVLKLGFQDFVHTRRGPYLFEELPHPKSADDYEATKAFSQWFGRYLTKIGVKSTGKVFHSFRHTFITQARNSGLNPQIISVLAGHESERSLVGHIGSSTTNLYGDAYTLTHLHSEINKISFFDLPTVR